MKLELKSPLKFFSINQKFGQNANGFYKEQGLLGHNGIDLFANDGDPVYAAHDGRVTFTGYDGAGGLGVVIRTEEKFGSTDGKYSYWKTIYWHLKKDSIKVTGSQQVKAGDLIALADNTGKSTGSHLHFALKPIRKGEKDWIWENEKQNNGYKGAVDPLPYLPYTEPIDPKIKFKELQTLLNKYGAKLEVDGAFGKLSKQALTNFLNES